MSQHASPAASGEHTKGSAGIAGVLWVIVVLGLLYGIWSTGTRVVDLFTG